MRAWIVISALLASCGGEEVKIECGNGAVEEGEQCDGDDLNTVTCEGRGFFAGELGCNDDCTFDTSACTDCGNGVVDTGEACDGDELAGATCVGLGFGDGELVCDACTIDSGGCSAPPLCGNGSRDAGEPCEGGDLDGQTCTGLGYLSGDLACTDQCRLDLVTCSGCTDDGFEENDDLVNAAPLTEGSFAGTLCNLDGLEIDWYAVSLLTGETLAVAVTSGDSMFGFISGITDDTGADIGAQVSGGWLYTAEADVTVYPWVAPVLQTRGVGSYGIDVVIDPVCLEHLDCPGGQLCEAFACEDSTCAEDDDCPFGFLCDNDECVQCVAAADCGSADWYSCIDGRCLFECTADSYEPNQTFDAPPTVAVGLDESGLTLCGPDDEDWYEVTLTEGQRYIFSATFAQGGDIDLELYAVADGSAVAAAGSNSEDEQLVFAVPTGDGGAYRLRVLLASGVAQSYTLAITDTGVAECFDDDTCTGTDEICFGFQCLVPVCLVDGDCTGTDRCVANDCVARPAGDTCGQAIAVATLPYQASADMAAFREDADVGGGGCTPWGTEGRDAIYRVTLAADDTLVAELVSDFDAALWIATQCSGSVPEAECLAGTDTVGTSERLVVTADAAGDVYVVVDTSAPGYPEDGGFTLSLSLE